MKILVFILSPTANAGCEILTLSESNGSYLIPSIEANENLQSETLKYSQNLLNVQNVELLTYLGSVEAVHAYVLRTIKVQLETQRLMKLGFQFVSLNLSLRDNVQAEAQDFWKSLTDYTQEYMIWE